MYPNEQSNDGSALSESGKSSDLGENGSLKKRDEKRMRKTNKNHSEPIYLPQYKQVNYMEMLTEIISKDFIDDRLAKFLHILNGETSPQRASQNLESVVSPKLSPGIQK